MKRALAMLLVVVALAVAAAAHGDKKHISGTLEKVNADSIVVKTREGDSVLIKLAPTTVFLRRSGATDQSAKAGDLAVGDLVVIHATPKDAGLEADEVKFSTRKARSTPPSNPNPRS